MSENKKPRIAEILGVEVGEPFKVDGYGSMNFYIDENGEACSNYTNDPDYCTAIYQAINHPDRIIRKPRWTKNEIRMAKAIKAIWPEAEDIRARNGTTSAIEYRVCAGRVVLGVIYSGYFPTMRCGEDYAIDEIIGGAE